MTSIRTTLHPRQITPTPAQTAAQAAVQPVAPALFPPIHLSKNLISIFNFAWKLFGPCPGGTCTPKPKPTPKQNPSKTSSTGKTSKNSAPSNDPPPAVKGDTAVERVLNLVAYIDENLQGGNYQATTQMDLDEGIFQCDCSGMVDWILSGAAPQAFKEVEATMKKKQGRPVVATYVAMLKKIKPDQPTPGWQHVAKIGDAKPGDIIAWPTPDWYPSDATGHMGIVVAEPEAVPGGFLIRIADSTSYPHGEDTRREGSGFGYGTILITIDEQTGEGIGQGWTGRHSEATVIRTPIYIGRPLS